MMPGGKFSLLRNIGWMGATTGLRLASGMLSFVIVARLLGPADFGVYMFWMSVAGLLTLLVNFGFTPLVLREIGANPASAKTLMSEVLTARALLAGVLLAAAGMASVIWLEGLQTFLLFSLLFALLADAMTDLFNVGFRATNRFALETRIATATSLLQLLLIAGSTWVWPRLEVAALAFLGSRLLVLALTWLLQRRYFEGVGLLSLQAGWLRIRKAVSYAVDFGLQSLFGQIDSLVLNHFLGPVAVGLFQAGMRLFNGGAQAASILANVFLPRAARAAGDPAAFAREAGKIQWAFVGTGLAFGLALALGAGWIVALLFGAAYAGLVDILPWLGLFFFVRFFAASWGIVLTAAGFQRFRAGCNAIQWLGVLGLALWLVPRWGVVGWVICVLVGNLFLLLAYAIRGMRHTGQGAWQPMIASLAALLFLPYLHLPA